MAKDEMRQSDKLLTIEAAGGLLWRPAADGYEIAVIFRNRYGDWTLPKGKLKKGESWEAAALREVQEETGFEVTLLAFAGEISYPTDKGPKIVRYWHMAAVGPSTTPIDDEVALVVWLPVEQARGKMDYPDERALLDAWQGPNAQRAWPE